MVRFNPRYVLALAMTFAALYIGLAIAGGVLRYSPVPYMDMWDSYLNFYVSSSTEGWRAWWSQHNEHRVVLARLLFWVDIAWLHGTGAFLIVMNYVLAGLSAALFYVFLRERLSDPAQLQCRRLMGLFILAWLFSWCQYENLTWGFQSQFFLSQLLPLATFFCVHKAATDTPRSTPWYAAACILGIAAVGTMANGVLALPLAFLLSLLLGLGKRKAALLLFLGVAGIAIYFHNFVAAGHHGSLRSALLNDPVGLFRYVLTYIGSPFYYFFGADRTGRTIAQVAGLFLIVVCIALSVRAIKARPMSSWSLALLTYILYVGGTALGTGGGRLVLGLNQAVASRYTTPALMAWAALLALCTPYLVARMGRWGHKPMWLALPLVAMTLPNQLTALEPSDELFDREVAALALELRINDDAQLKKVYPRPHVVMTTSQAAVERDLSIFGIEPIKNVHQLMGTQQSVTATSTCDAKIDTVRSIGEDQRYVRIQGGMLDRSGKGVKGPVHVLNKEGVLVGYALIDSHRSGDDDAKRRYRFKGYLLAAYAGQRVTLASTSPACTSSVVAPQKELIRFVASGLDPTLVNVEKRSVLENNGWVGADYQRTTADGLVVLGSYIHADSDVGSLTLALKRGDTLLYRSGPDPARQHVEIDHRKDSFISLPFAREWTLLDFSDAHLPDMFTATFVDAGDGWGEWSAIAVKE